MGGSFNIRRIEEKSRQAWQQADCFRAPEIPRGEKFFNFDSGPFPNGPLHLGHVRTYVLGDVTARYQRLRGKCVLYGTEWDAFGLPIEIGAAEAGVSPREYTAANIERMRAGLVRLGVSYDWSRVQSTCDRDYYCWTQWLFTELFKRGLANRKPTEAAWCPDCNTSLATMQAPGGRCWRCETPVTRRTTFQWFIKTSLYEDRLRQGIDQLHAWSEPGRKLLCRGLARETSYTLASETDWNVSRQRKWGTPIPAIHCGRCGIAPSAQLPVVSPEIEDAADPGAQPDARTEFISVPCPICGAAAFRDADTLDCFFDDSWSYLSCVASLSAGGAFPAARLAAWMPVDRFHSGFDTFAYLNLYRFVGYFLHDLGLLEAPEPFLSYMGHDMVLAGGRKMSKHLGNVVSPDAVIEEFGADALRIAILWAAAPERTLDWQHANVARASAFLEQCLALHERCQTLLPVANADPRPGVSDAISRLQTAAAALWRRVGELIDAYRPNAAIEELHEFMKRLQSSALHRLESKRVNQQESTAITRMLRNFAVALSPFAPHVAEELAQMTALGSLAATAAWPDSA